jgi:hypothetical protein
MTFPYSGGRSDRLAWAVPKEGAKKKTTKQRIAKAAFALFKDIKFASSLFLTSAETGFKCLENRGSPAAGIN